MDNYCLKLGWLLDNPARKPLKNPESHSIHCIVDVGVCWKSNYVILNDPAGPGEDYTIGYDIGPEGTLLVKNHANEQRKLGQYSNYRTTVTGYPDGLGNLKCVSLGDSSDPGGLGLAGLGLAGPAPTSFPTIYPTNFPTVKLTGNPTGLPTPFPTAKATSAPTGNPTGFPTVQPTAFPTVPPTAQPTALAPAVPTPTPTASRGGFDFGGRCDGGTGSFGQAIERNAKVTVGTIPAGKANVRVDLKSPVDVDVQLVDAATGDEIVAWPSGLLNGPTEQSVQYHGVLVKYSGYNGGQKSGALGNEWIELVGTTDRDLVMLAFGYAAGDAEVNYAWTAPADCVDQGQGAFVQDIANREVVVVGTIPAGKSEVVIRLSADADVDVQLFDATAGTAVIAWPTGTINGASEECIDHAGNRICYSGYNGNQKPGGLGKEWISIRGDSPTAVPYTMKAYGYAAGNADVEYSWGQSGYCSGSAECVAAADTLAAGAVMTEGHCTGTASPVPCAWVTSKPYDGDRR